MKLNVTFEIRCIFSFGSLCILDLFHHSHPVKEFVKDICYIQKGIAKQKSKVTTNFSKHRNYTVSQVTSSNLDNFELLHKLY